MTPALKQELTANQYLLLFCRPSVKKGLRRTPLQLTDCSEQTPLQTLRTLVQEFLARHPRLTIQALATRANVPVTSLRRIVGDSSKSEVAPHTALNLCAYIAREKNIAKLLELLPQVLAEYLSKHFGSFVFEGNEKRTYDSDLNQILQDRTNYFIYKLAANRGGTTLDEVTELFGSVGKKHANALIEKDVIRMDGNRLFARDPDFSLDLKIAAGHLPELVKMYRPDAVAHGLNLMYSLSETLNEQAIKSIKDIQREAVKATHAIMNNPESFGDIPYFTINLCESFKEPCKGIIQ